MSLVQGRPPRDLSLTNFTAENAAVRNRITATNLDVEQHVSLRSVTLNGFTIHALFGGVFPSSQAGSVTQGNGFTANVLTSLTGTVAYTTPLSQAASVRLTAQAQIPVTASISRSDRNGFSYITSAPTEAIHFTAVN